MLGDCEARNDFWSISGNYINRHHRWTKSQTFRAERRVIINSTTIYRRGENYKYDLRCHAWTPHWRWLEYRKGPRSIRCVDGFHMVHHIGWKTSKGIHGPGGGWQKNKQRKEKQMWTVEKSKLDNARKLKGIYFIDPTDVAFKETSRKCAEKVGSSDAHSHALQDQEKQARGNL